LIKEGEIYLFYNFI